MLRGASVMSLNLGDTAGGLGYARDARELDLTLGNHWGVAYSTMMMGNCLAEARDDSRDLVGAQKHLAESAALFEKLGDRFYALIAKNNQAWIVGELGDPEGEDRLHQESLAIAREIGNAGIEADALAQLGMSARDDGRLDDAVALLRESITIDHRRGMAANIATNLGRLASVLVRRGDAIAAARLLAVEQAVLDQQGADMPWWAKRRANETLDLIKKHLDPAAIERASSEGRSLSVDEAVALALGESERVGP
jgi:tetratricopeptide (TPR) repeat protein